MDYCVIGASAAGITAVTTLRKLEPDAKITLISTDDHVYSRCMLHKYLSGERDLKGINFTTETFDTDLNINWLKGKTVSKVDTQNNCIICDSGESISYDKLLIATGAQFVIPPIENLRTCKNIFGFRDFVDAKLISDIAENKNRAVIIGAGLVGMDVAIALLERKLDVTVIEMANRIIALQLDDECAKEYQDRFEAHGCKFILGAKVAAAVPDSDNNVSAIRLDSGEEIPCDFAIVAAGVRPNIGFLENSGIEIDRSVKVDMQLRTSAPNVFAAGDVTGLSGIWSGATKQGEIAAKNMAGANEVYDDTFALKNTSNFYGLLSLSVGNMNEEHDEELVRKDSKTYQKIFLKNNIVKAFIMQGNIDYSGIWQHLIKHKISVEPFRDRLFNLSFADFYGYDENSGEYKWFEK